MMEFTIFYEKGIETIEAHYHEIKAGFLCISVLENGENNKVKKIYCYNVNEIHKFEIKNNSL